MRSSARSRPESLPAAARLGARIVAVLIACAGAAAHAHPGRGIVVGADGGVYLSDAVRSVVWRLAPDGRFAAAAVAVHAHWLAIGPDGVPLADHVVYDAATGRFLRGLVRIDGPEAVTTIIAPRPDPDGLDAAAFAVLGADLYIARDSTPIIEVRRHGRTVRTLALPAAAATVNSLGVDAEGRVVAVRGREVLRLDAGGEMRVLFEAPSGSDDRILGLRDLWGLAFGAEGTIYTTDPGLRRVIAIDPDGRSRPVHEVEPPWFPTGVATKGPCVLLLEHGLVADRNLGPRITCVTEGREPQVLGQVPDLTSQVP